MFCYREVLENARTFEDSLLARSTQIYSLGSRNKQMEAIQIGLETLKQLGEGLPSIRTSRLRVYLEFRRVKSLLRGLSDEDILKLPRMKDPKKLAAMQILNHVILSTMYAAPNLSALVALRMIELTVKSGLSAIASVGFALFGTMLCRYVESACLCTHAIKPFLTHQPGLMILMEAIGMESCH